MKIGIKYCGGCNPRYERGRLLADLRADFEGQHVFQTAQDNEVYEALIVIGGCTSCCAKHEHFVVTGKTFFVKVPGDYDILVQELK